MSQNWAQDVYVKAWDFATEAHEGQTYGGPKEGQRIAYINHIGSVAMELICGLNEAPHLDGNLAVQCALLHDTLEDTDVDFQLIETTFGQDVAEGVQALTKNAQLFTKEAQMQDSLDRIKRQPKEVWMVKMADRITNLSEPPSYWTDEKREQYKQEAQVIYDELHEASAFLASRLFDRIRDYSKYIKN